MQFSSLLLWLLPLVALAQKTEKEVLIVFYNSLGGSSWINKAGWEDALTNPESDICDWFGVVCTGEEADLEDPFDGRRLADSTAIPSPSPTKMQTLNFPRDPSTPVAPPIMGLGSPVAPFTSSPMAAPITNAPVASTPTKPPVAPTTSAPVANAGVPTTPTFRRVIGIQLPNNNLQGRVPTSVWRLPALKYFSVSYNQIDIDFQNGSTSLVEIKMHSTITTSLSGIGHFTSLKSIHMSGSKLGHVVLPLELFDLVNLEYLFMAQCELEGSIPEAVSNLVKVDQLNFYDNDLTGTLPAGLAAVTNLRVLTLSLNKLEGTLPSYLGKFPDLEELYLDGNRFTGSLLPFDTLQNLNSLFLNSNLLVGTIPATFLTAAVNAKTEEWQVDLGENNLDGDVPASLEILAGLNLTLSLSNNAFRSFEGNSLCDNTNWNGGDVSKFGCNGIACPIGSTSRSGRATTLFPCQRCTAAVFVGTTTCLDGNDKVSLAELYKETGGDHWHRNEHWLSSKDHCEWYGVTCWNTTDERAGRVRRLDLDSNGLIGTVPNSLYSMSELTTMSFSRNKVVVGFEGIGTTQAMYSINVARTDTTDFEGIQDANQFFQILIADQLLIEGTLPKEIYELSSLRTLSLAECNLNGILDEALKQLSNLEELYLWGNNLRGKIPEGIGALTALSILSLAKNSLTGPLPEVIGGLTALNAFTVKDQVSKGGGLTGGILSFSSAPKLTNLVLAGNLFEGKIPTNLLQMVSLDEYIIADLSSNILTGEVPGQLARFERLNILAADNIISGIDSRLCAMDDWMGGNVREFGCAAILCPEYTTNTRGRMVYDNQNCVDCVDPEVRPILGQTKCGAKDLVLTEHNILQLFYSECGGTTWTRSKNWYSDVHVCDWYGVACDDEKSVVSIVLGDNGMQGTLPSYIYSLPNLAQLSLFYNPLLTVTFDGIEMASNLEELVLDTTGLTSLVGIGKGRSLTKLNVRNNNLAGTLPEDLSRLVNMETLELSSNRFTGSIPSWLSKIPSLSTFLVDDNELTGEIPDFEGFERITFLNISNNNFAGSIPETFLTSAGRDDKIFVDISANKLTGTLPYNLERLNRLGIKADQNKLSAIDPYLCTLEAWNDYDVQAFGCAGILCPKGTYNDYGRQINAESPCLPCKAAAYLGAAQCSSATRLLAGFGLLTFVCFGSMFL